MSNRVTIQRTTFTPYNGGEASFGYRAYDDHGQTYDNTLSEEQMKLSDEEFFRYVVDYGDTLAQDMISFLLEYDNGLYIDDTWYDYDWVKKQLDKDCEAV